MVITRRFCAAAGLLLLAVGPLAAVGLEPGPGAGFPLPLLVRITAFVDTAPPGEQTLGPLTVGVDHQVKTLALIAVQMLNGPLTEGRAALRQQSLYHPNFLLIGNPELLQQIRSAPAQSKLTLFGYFRPGSTRMLVVEVDRP